MLQVYDYPDMSMKKRIVYPIQIQRRCSTETTPRIVSASK
jgi:hypothetical protein